MSGSSESRPPLYSQESKAEYAYTFRRTTQFDSWTPTSHREQTPRPDEETTCASECCARAKLWRTGTHSVSAKAFEHYAVYLSEARPKKSPLFSNLVCYLSLCIRAHHSMCSFMFCTTIKHCAPSIMRHILESAVKKSKKENTKDTCTIYSACLIHFIPISRILHQVLAHLGLKGWHLWLVYSSKETLCVDYSTTTRRNELSSSQHQDCPPSLYHW